MDFFSSEEEFVIVIEYFGGFVMGIFNNFVDVFKFGGKCFFNEWFDRFVFL